MKDYTQGPWLVNESKFTEVLTQDRLLVATCNRIENPSTLYANAKLIAAAPELLQSLKDCLEMDIHARVCKPWREKAQAAVAKAIGAKE